MYAARFLSLGLLLFLAFPTPGPLCSSAFGSLWDGIDGGHRPGPSSRLAATHVGGLSIQHSPSVRSAVNGSFSSGTSPDAATISVGFQPLYPEIKSSITASSSLRAAVPSTASNPAAHGGQASWQHHGLDLLIAESGGSAGREGAYPVAVSLVGKRRVPRETREPGSSRDYMSEKESLSQWCNPAPLFRFPPICKPDLRASWALWLVRTLVRVLEFFALQILFLIALLSLLLLALLFLKGMEWFLGLSVVDLEFSVGRPREAALSGVRGDVDQELVRLARNEQGFFSNADEVEAAAIADSGGFTGA